MPETYLDRLNKQVVERDPDVIISIDRYLLTGQTLLNQANIYRKTEDKANVYLLLFRFANLMLYTLPKHPNYMKNSPKVLSYRKKLRDECIPELERLKKEFMLMPAQSPKRQRSMSVGLDRIGISAAPQIDWKDAGARQAEALPPPQRDTIPPEVLHSSAARQISTHIRGPSIPLHRPAQPSGPPQFKPKYQASLKGIEKHSLFSANLPPAEAFPRPPEFPRQEFYPESVELPNLLPAVPEQQIIVDVPKEIEPPPQQVEVQNVPLPSPGDALHSCAQPAPPVEVGSITQLAPALEESTGFRDVHVSPKLLEAFNRVAKLNTEKSIETCGILAGQLRPDLNVLEVTHLLIPRQKGSTDQVEMLDEELLLGEVLSQGLMVLGWVHTHPIYQCFMSSIDVHTTLPYQLLLDEAIAIVMAPTDRNRKCGVFRLSTPGGMDLIRNCSQRGFHHHGQTKTGQPIYEVSSHVYFDPKTEVRVKDMR